MLTLSLSSASAALDFSLDTLAFVIAPQQPPMRYQGIF
jgi:hypothetical protein